MAKKKHNYSFKKAFQTFIWPRRGMLSIGLVLIVINRFAGLVLPVELKTFVDEVIPSEDINELWKLLGIVTAALVIQSTTSFALTRLLSVEAQRLIAKLRAEVQHKVLRLPINFFDNNKSGALVSRIMTDVEGVRNLVGTGLVQLIGGSITAIVSIILLFRINPLMTGLVLIPVVIFGVIALKAFSYIRPIFKKRGEINAEVTGRLTETLNGVRVIKGFSAEQHEMNVFEKGVYKLFDNVKKSLTASALVTSLATLLLGMGSVIIMGLSGHFIMFDDMTTGDFIQFTGILAFMIAPIIQMSNIGTQLTEALAGLDRTEEIMQTIEESDEEERQTMLSEVVGDIKFNNVKFAYEEEKDVLHGITFDAPAGSVTALVGTSGSGKSTIAGLAASFLNPQSGSITIDNVDLSKVKLSSYREQLGVVLQDDFLFEGTIKENILFSKHDATDAEINAAVKAAHIDQFTDKFDDGLDTLIGERGVKLSGGQRQRIAIARAILADPKILLLDEATSNLDTESESYIQDSLQQLLKGRTTFVIAHRLSTIRQANQILVIEDGTIAEQGTHDTLMAQEGRYFELYNYQARI